MRPLIPIAMALLLAAGCSEDRGGFGASQPRPSPSPGSPSPGAGAPQDLGTVEVAAPGGFRFEPDRIRVPAGGLVTFEFANRDGQAHTFAINELNLHMQAGPGETVRLPYVVAQGLRGRFAFYCSLPGHLEQGMQGTAVVR